MFNKEIIKNFLSFGAVEVLGLLVPIITMPILTRGLGPENYGVLLYLMTLVFFGPTFIDYGTQFTSVRELAKKRSDKDKLGEIFVQTQTLRVLLAVVYIAVSGLYVFVFKFNELFFVFLCAGIPYLLGYSLLPVWFYQGVGKAEKPLKILLLSKIVSMFIIVAFVNDESDLTLVAIALCWPMFFCGVFFAYKIIKIYKKMFDFYSVRSQLYVGRDVFLGNLAPNFYNTIPILVLGSLYSPAEFAQFAVASRLCTIGITVQNVFIKAAYPVLVQLEASQVNKLMLIGVVISLPLLVLTYLYSVPVLYLLLGNGFGGVSKFLMIMVFGVLFVGLSNAYSKGFFLPNGYDALYRSVALKVSLVSAVISAILIFYYGIIGGAIAITIARFLFFLSFSVSYYKLNAVKS